VKKSRWKSACQYHGIFILDVQFYVFLLLCY